MLATCGKEIPDRDFGFGYVDTQITEVSPSRQRFQRRHHWLCLQHFGRLSPERLLAILFELVQPLGYVVPGSVCKEHIGDLSQFVTNSSRMELLHDAPTSERK